MVSKWCQSRPGYPSSPYGVAGTTTGLSNLSIAGTSWLDAAGISLADVHPYASFGLEQVGSDVYLTFQAVPEPSSLVLLGIGGALAGLAARRRSISRRGDDVRR